MTSALQTASIIMAAGRGSRMASHDGNKTLLPLVPGSTPFSGTHPILLHIFGNLPAGPKAVIIHHKSEDVREATAHLHPTYCRQPELNGTGGALIAAREFLDGVSSGHVLITMGDVPFVAPGTYQRLLDGLADHDFMVLGFSPKDRKQYGVLELREGMVEKITEWKYWKDYPEDRRASLDICNGGIYAARTVTLRRYLPILEARPQTVLKERDGRMVEIREYFLTDLVEYLRSDGLAVGCVLAADEIETMGIDDPDALRRAQEHYRHLATSGSPTRKDGR